MKTGLFLLFFNVFFFDLFAQNIPQDIYTPNEIFVMVNPNAELDLSYNPQKGDLKTDVSKEIVSTYLIHEISRPFIALKDEQLQHTYVFKFSDNKLVDLLIQELKTLSYVVLVEKVPQYKELFTPNDFKSSWSLTKIQAKQAWDITQGSADVVIAIIDGAVKITHQDLISKIWINPGEIMFNGIDDDGNGYVDDIRGWDMADYDNNVSPPSSASMFSHGTHVAGIAAGATNNNKGHASIGFKTTIMPIKVSKDASGVWANVYSGVAYAISNHADIINMSWGSNTYSTIYQLIFNHAYSQGIVCVGGAGNSNVSTPFYPAAYNHVIAVAASNAEDVKANFSNFGSYIDVTAPGVTISGPLSTSNSSYGNKSGTSMACPIVSGIIGLMLSLDPTMTPDQIEQCLESSCDNINYYNPGFFGKLGAGRVNALKALQCVQGDAGCANTNEPNESLSTAKTINIGVDIKDQLASITDVDFFKFTTTSIANIQVNLSNLPADYDLKLYKQTGTQIGASENWGTNSENIFISNAAPGTYKISVQGYGGAYSNTSCYNLKVTSSSALTARMTELNEEKVDIESIPQLTTLSVFPNPNQGVFSINIEHTQEENAILRILDYTGKLVYEQKQELLEGKVQQEVFLNHILSGVYLVQVQGENWIKQEKIIVE